MANAMAKFESVISPFKMEDLGVAALSNQSDTAPIKVELQKNIEGYLGQCKNSPLKLST
jgi:hypothetical protein